MSREQAIHHISQHFDSGEFLRTLQSRVAIRSESQHLNATQYLYDYLNQAIIPALNNMGFQCEILANPMAPAEQPDAWPLLFAQRVEDPQALTILTYGHGDVVMGNADEWREGLSPWKMKIEEDYWYGRGAADNKGQHSVNLAALETVLKTRGSLGFNTKILLEMGEEAGSPGLAECCTQYKDKLSADLFIASDGPRVAAEHPTVFLGSRGAMNFDLVLKLREGSHHSGNWGGVLVNPATRLTHAWSTMVNEKGRILLDGLLPDELPESVRQAVRSIPVGQGERDPAITAQWGDPDLNPAEQLFGWNTLEILAMNVGNPAAPLNAIPGQATLHAQIRFVVGSHPEQFLSCIRAHLDANGFEEIEVQTAKMHVMPATRLDPDNPWVSWMLDSIATTTGKPTTLLPNLAGSIPNDCFASTLGLPTLWIPHSYPACLQHGPNEHVLGSVMKESLQLMAGVFWDLGEITPTSLKELNHG